MLLLFMALRWSWRCAIESLHRRSPSLHHDVRGMQVGDEPPAIDATEEQGPTGEPGILIGRQVRQVKRGEGTVT